ncbi:type II toxin-antitoxin system RelE/ParE family toxin [Pseudomonas sp. NPDC087358]|uniref:type II toxin-antitoxin system RelE/ParE family toxin n=1 Tax=Pseudomonas sp. NPDC087358 TaxID=3364439 RepID=UPI003850CF5D
MPKIALTDKAQSDLESIHAYYAVNCGRDAANRVVLALLESLERLRTFNGLGRPSQLPDVRELMFGNLPYVAPYRINKGEVQILRVLHQRTDFSCGGGEPEGLFRESPK